MDDARSLVGGDERAEQDAEHLPARVFEMLEVRKDGIVLGSFEGFSLEHLQHFVVIRRLVQLVHSLLHHDQFFSAGLVYKDNSVKAPHVSDTFDNRILEVGMNSKS